MTPDSLHARAGSLRPQLAATPRRRGVDDETNLLRCTRSAAADRRGLPVFDLPRLSGGILPGLSWTPIYGCADTDIAEARTTVLTDRGGGPNPHAEFAAADGRRVVRALLHAAGLADATVTELLGGVDNPP